MGIKAKIRVWSFKFKAFMQPYKRLEWKIGELDRIVNSIALALEDMVRVNHENLLAQIKILQKEPVLRKAQGKRANEKFKEFAHEINDRVKAVATTKNKEIESLYKLIIDLSANVDFLNSMKDKFKKIDALKEKVDIDYARYNKEVEMYHEKHMQRLHNVIDQYKKEISEFKKNDNAVVRLAGLEERITLLEISHREKRHNGSGQTVSGSIRAD